VCEVTGVAVDVASKVTFESVSDAEVGTADGRHRHEVSVEKLDAFFGTKDARLAHSMVLVDGDGSNGDGHVERLVR
jgi:hypothetical protein